MENEKTERPHRSSDGLFDLDKIPMEVLDRAYKSYRPYMKDLGPADRSIPNRLSKVPDRQEDTQPTDGNTTED